MSKPVATLAPFLGDHLERQAEETRKLLDETERQREAIEARFGPAFAEQRRQASEAIERAIAERDTPEMRRFIKEAAGTVNGGGLSRSGSSFTSESGFGYRRPDPEPQRIVIEVNVKSAEPADPLADPPKKRDPDPLN